MSGTIKTVCTAVRMKVNVHVQAYIRGPRGMATGKIDHVIGDHANTFAEHIIEGYLNFYEHAQYVIL